MQNVYDSASFFDVQAMANGLPSDILMENAASHLECAVLNTIKESFKANPFWTSIAEFRHVSVLIFCGSGNNGADGYTLARRLQQKAIKIHKDKTLIIKPIVYFTKNPKTEQCIEQAKRAHQFGCEINAFFDDVSHTTVNSTLEKYCIFSPVIVDCLIGTGFGGTLDASTQIALDYLQSIRQKQSYTSFVACDIPTGLTNTGLCATNPFCADITVTMGCYKTALFSDEAKAFVGRIEVAELGIAQVLFENPPNVKKQDLNEKQQLFLLEQTDMQLPFRLQKNCHKGMFGHAVFFAGEKVGACILATNACAALGCGLVSVVQQLNTVHEPENHFSFPPEIMLTKEISQKLSALCIGMGTGHESPLFTDFFDYAYNHIEIPCVLDADSFYQQDFPLFIDKRGNCVITPHPKEFAHILKICNMGDFSIDYICKNRIELCRVFCKRYPNIVLILKGANSLICYNDSICINDFGTNVLARGGSGDTLAGLITSLLAQGYGLVEAAKNASLIHTIAGRNVSKANYAVCQADILNEITQGEL